MVPGPGSITEQFFKLFAGRGLPGISFRLGFPIAPGKLEIFTEVANGLFQDRLGPALAALLGHARVVTLAVQADAQIGPTFHAYFPAPRVAGQGPWLAALVAMTFHPRLLNRQIGRLAKH
jgi:hypothetical protein